MPLLDITTAQYSFQDHIRTLRSLALFRGSFICGNGERLASLRKSSQFPSKANNFNLGHSRVQRPERLIINAVVTLEPLRLAPSNDEHEVYRSLQTGTNSNSASAVEHQFSTLRKDLSGLDEREKMRRIRISKANKGNKPWNKGKKHSPETLKRIRERTRLAMQDPKVKMKLANLGHAQSEETRIKIGVGVRMGWEKRRGKLMVQEVCHFKWQNLIAEASRKGFDGEEELQWDSYVILDEELKQEWLESIEQRKNRPRPKGNKRAPKSAEQRRKISEAIAAKWADPSYRDRVYSALSKYHGTPVGVERKRRKPKGDGHPRRRPTKKNADDSNLDNSARTTSKGQNQRSRLKRSCTPLYKDPLASSKLEMIKNIRAQRATIEHKKYEAVSRAKLLIAEAEKAAKALELAAMRSPIAQASLVETRKLIAEAIQSIQSIETGQIDSQENSRALGECPNLDGEMEALESTKSDIQDFGFDGISLHGLVNGKDTLPATARDFGVLNGNKDLDRRSRSNNEMSSSFELGFMINKSSFAEQPDQLDSSMKRGKNLMPNGVDSVSHREEKLPSSLIVSKKKWVRGRLVEVAEEDHD